MIKNKKRLLAVLLTLALCLTGIGVINVFAEEQIKLPTASEIGYGRSMYALYELYQDGTIDRDTFDAALSSDLSSKMDYSIINGHHEIFSVKRGTDSKGKVKSGMEDMSFTKTDSLNFATMYWYLNAGHDKAEYDNNFVYLMGANVTYVKGGSVSNNYNAAETLAPDQVGYYYTLMKAHYRSYDTYRMQWTMSFYKYITMDSFSFYALDKVDPGATGWNVSLMETGDLENTTYQLKFSPKNADKLRAANTGITKSDIGKIGLTVTMQDDRGRVYRIPAKAVDVKLDGIYFDFYGQEWEALHMSDKNLIVSYIEVNNEAQGSFWIYDITSRKNLTELTGLTSEYPITDVAGNKIQLNSSSTLTFSDLRIDRVRATVVEMDFRPSTYVSGGTEANKSDSYLGGLTLYNDYSVFSLYFPSVVLNESVIVDAADYENVYALLNIYDKNGNQVKTPLRYVRRASYEGNSNCTELQFESIDIKPGMYSLAGESVKIVGLQGDEFIKDSVGNNTVQNANSIGELSAPCIVYVDGTAPNVTVDTAVIQWKDAQGNYYDEFEKIQDKVTAIALTVPILVQDTDKIIVNGQEVNIAAVGAGTTTGYLALYHNYESQSMDYRYTVTQTPAFPADSDTSVTWSQGTLSGYERANYSAFGVGKEGSYVYLHMELSGLENHEFSDVNGLKLYLQLQDMSENRISTTQTITGIHVDNVAPALNINKSNVFPHDGKATLRATASAADTNGVASLWYAWTDEATDDPVFAEFTDSAISCEVEGTGEVRKHLYVKAVDVYGNYTVKHEIFEMNLKTAISQYEISGDLSELTADPGITVSAPLTSDGTATPETAVSRFTIAVQSKVDGTYGYELYFRYFDSTAANEDPFAYGEGITWYRLPWSYSQSKPTNLQDAEVVEGVPGWANYYGQMDLYIASNLAGLSNNVWLEGEDDATYSYEKIGTLSHAPAMEELYRISYAEKVYDSQGVEVRAVDSDRDDNGGLLSVYYRFNGDMTGVKFGVNLANTAVADWGVQGMDLKNSYAVMVSVNKDGTIQKNEDGSYMEVTDRIPLDASLKQILTVPGSTVDGNRFTTGCYTWVICVAQKGGAEQIFDDCYWYILFDNAIAATEDFGIRSHTNYLDVTYGDNTVIENVTQAENGVLDTIYVGMAQVTEKDYNYNADSGTVVHTINGYQAYSTGELNGLINQRSTDPTATFTITASIGENADYGTWMGDQTLGGIAGIRFWNKASIGGVLGSVSYVTETQSYRNNGVEGIFDFDETTGVATLKVSFLCGTSAEQGSNIVSAEDLAASVPGAFSVVRGSNTICYQLIMENGTESPVYQFNMELVEEVPQVKMDFEYGIAHEWVQNLDDNTGIDNIVNGITTAYIDVYFTDVFSSYSDLSVYYVYYDYDTQGSYGMGAGEADHYMVRKLTEQELSEGFRITQGCSTQLKSEGIYRAQDGYLGTRTSYSYPYYSNYGTDCFFVVTDASGNATAVYPINDRDYGHMIDSNYDQYWYYFQISDMEDGTASYEAAFGEDGMGKYMDRVEVFIDRELAEDGSVISEGYTIYTQDADYDYAIVPQEYGASMIEDRGTVETTFGSGAIGYQTYPESGYEYLAFAWPYDSSVAEGELVNHTVEIVITVGERKVTKTFEFSVPNTKPAFTAQTLIGSVELDYNVPVKTQNSGISDTDYILLTDASLYGTEMIVDFTDLYGNIYKQNIAIDPMPGLEISYSTTEPTTGAVTVTVKYGTAMNVDTEALVNVTAAGSGTGELQLTFTKNEAVDLFDPDGMLIGRIRVTNIFDTLEVSPYIYWDYRACDVQEGNVVYGNVTAYLMDENGATILDPATGEQAKVVFFPGGETSYTFSGCISDRGTAVEDVTATLAVKLDMEPSEEVDDQAPDLDIVSYVTFERKSYDAKAVYRLNSGRFDDDFLTDYEVVYQNQNCYFNSVSEMISSLGWAESYMFHFEIRDESKVKLILRADLYDENISYNSVSDTIEGVKLVGRTLEIKENVEFALYVVDESNNITGIHFQTASLGAEPVPNTEQVLTRNEDGLYVVRVYLLPLQMNGVTNLKITSEGAMQDAKDFSSSDSQISGDSIYDNYAGFDGLYYMVYNDNGNYVINYSYDYREQTRTGSVQVAVKMIDNTVPAVAAQAWSQNYFEDVTNQDVTWQARLNTKIRSISIVYANDGDYAALASGTLADYGLNVSYMEDRLTVYYEQSTTALEAEYGKLYMKVIGMNNVMSYLELPSLSKIDKTAPELETLVSYAPNHKSATVTIRSNETVISQNANQKGTEFSFNIRENTTETYSFVDAAGNRSSVDVVVDGLILEDLTITLMDASGSIITNPARYNAEIGQTLKVLTNRPATVWVFGEELNAVECDGVNAVELVVSENNMGLHPTFGAEDAYGNSAMVQLEYIMPRNMVAPVIVMNKRTVSVSANATEDEIMAAALANIIYSDDATAKNDLIVEVGFRRSSDSKAIITYTVTDDAGNYSTAQCWLKIRNGLVPKITVNGREVENDDILYLGNVTEATVTVTFAAEVSEPYKLVYEAGNLLSWAKLKDGIYLTNGYSEEGTASYTLTELEDGWYSFALTTQSMEVYYFQIYIGQVR